MYREVLLMYFRQICRRWQKWNRHTNKNGIYVLGSIPWKSSMFPWLQFSSTYFGLLQIHPNDSSEPSPHLFLLITCYSDEKTKHSVHISHKKVIVISSFLFSSLHLFSLLPFIEWYLRRDLSLILFFLSPHGELSVKSLGLLRKIRIVALSDDTSTVFPLDR